MKFKGPGGAKKEIALRGRLTTTIIFSLSGAAASERPRTRVALPDYLVSSGGVKSMEDSEIGLPRLVNAGHELCISLYPGQKFLAPRMRAFVDHISKRILIYLSAAMP